MGKTETELNSRESSREIKADIERTRAEMDRTVDELTEQLNPRHVLNDMLARFKSGDGSSQLKSGAKTAGKWFIRGVGRHPLPSAVIGAGVAWLIVDLRARRTPSRETELFEKDAKSGVLTMSSEPGFEKSTSPGLRDEMGSGYEFEGCDFSEPSAGMTGESRVEKGKAKISQAAAQVKAKAAQAAGKASHWSKEKIESMRRSGRESGETISHKSQAVRDDMKHRLVQVKSGMERGFERATEVVDEYPLIVGISAMALGLLVGLTVPATRREKRIVGPKASRWRAQAEHLMERGKQVARSAADAIKSEAERQGLTAAGMKESLSQVARSAGETADEEGLTPEGIIDRVEMVAEEATETVKDEFRKEEKRGF